MASDKQLLIATSAADAGDHIVVLIAADPNVHMFLSQKQPLVFEGRGSRVDKNGSESVRRGGLFHGTADGFQALSLSIARFDRVILTYDCGIAIDDRSAEAATAT